MDGNLTRNEVLQALQLAKKGAMEIYRLQRDAIMRRYIEEEEAEEEIGEVEESIGNDVEGRFEQPNKLSEEER
jgi:hypothetical protein